MNEKVTEIRRNTRLLGEIEAAVAFRIAYRNPDGQWVRLRADETLLKEIAHHTIMQRFDKIVPSAVEQTINEAMSNLVDELNSED